MLLDVEVTDADGNPIPGLTRKDFQVQLDGRVQEIYSLDDLCRVPDDSLVAALPDEAPGATGEAEQPSPGAATETTRTRTVPAAAEEIRFILYLDFSRLRPFGRANAIEESRRWIHETKRPGDIVQIVAYASVAGMKRLTPFTSDAHVLLAAVDAAERDPQWVDPFPTSFDRRIEECCACCADVVMRQGCTCFPKELRPKPPCCPVCLVNARDEFFHGKHSLEALAAYLRGLEDLPGRKAVILFYENGLVYPSQFYPKSEVPVFRAGDNVAELDQAGAEANLSRATIHFTGHGDPVLHRFRYLYRYSDEQQSLLDFRVPRHGDAETLLTEANRVGLDSYGLPIYLLRAYSWVFIFHEDKQALYRYTLSGEDRALHRPAWRVEFEPIPPIQADYNDWFGAAWIDRETYQLLHVEAQRPEDRQQQRLMDRMARAARRSGEKGYRGTYPILKLRDGLRRGEERDALPRPDRDRARRLRRPRRQGHEGPRLPRQPDLQAIPFLRRAHGRGDSRSGRGRAVVRPGKAATRGRVSLPISRDRARRSLQSRTYSAVY